MNCDLFSQQHASALLFMRIQILRQKVLLAFVPESFLFSPFPYIKQTQTNYCYTHATHLYKCIFCVPVIGNFLTLSLVNILLIFCIASAFRLSE